ASIVLAELKGKMADEKGETSLMAALGKTVAKIEKNQQADGTFAGNDGWASVLSQGLANKGISRAAQAGAKVKGDTLDRIQGQLAANFDDKAKTFKPSGDGVQNGSATYAKPDPKTTNARATTGRSPTQTAPATSAPTDAGVMIYGCSSGLTNACDVVN